MRYTTLEDTPLVVSAPGLLANATDIDTGDTLTAVAESKAMSHGNVTILATGSFTYTPASNFNGEDSFSWSVRDSAGATTTGTVTVTIGRCISLPIMGTSRRAIEKFRL